MENEQGEKNLFTELSEKMEEEAKVEKAIMIIMQQLAIALTLFLNFRRISLRWLCM